MSSVVITVFMLSFPETGGCFRDGLLLEIREPIFEFNSRALTYSSIPANFHIHLFISKPGRVTANDTLTVRLQGMIGPPNIIIVCHQNCDRLVNPTESIYLSAYCINCPNGERLTYVWDVRPLTSLAAVQYFDWDKYAPSGKHNYFLEINAETFTTSRSDDSYIVTASGQ